MNSVEKRVLLAVHDEGLIRTLPRILSYAGYHADLAKNKEELLEKAKQAQYHACIMDVNFERPQSLAMDISEEVYGILLKKIPPVKFMAITGDPHIVMKAREKGIPTTYKSEMDLLTFLRA